MKSQWSYARIAISVLALILSACQKPSNSTSRNPYVKSEKNIDTALTGQWVGGCYYDKTAKNYVSPTTNFGADGTVKSTQSKFTDGRCKDMIAGSTVAIDGDSTTTYLVAPHSKTPASAIIVLTTVMAGNKVAIQSYRASLMRNRVTGQDIFMASPVLPAATPATPPTTAPSATPAPTSVDTSNSASPALSQSPHSFVTLVKKN